MNLNKLNLLPNQNAEHRYSQCVGESVAGIVSNIVGVPMDSGFTEAMGFRIGRQDPTTAGEDPVLGMQSAILYGTLPVTAESFTALSTSELQEDNWKNYSALQIADARPYVQNDIIALDTFQEIVGYLTTHQMPVSLPMKWYASFGATGADGMLPEPGGAITHHNAIVYGINEQGNLILEPHLGPDWGAGGYCYLTPERYAQVADPSYYAMGFDPNANRIWGVIRIAATRLFIPL